MDILHKRTVKNWTYVLFLGQSFFFSGNILCSLFSLELSAQGKEDFSTFAFRAVDATIDAINLCPSSRQLSQKKDFFQSAFFRKTV